MSYVDGFVAAVPAANREAYAEHEKQKASAAKAGKPAAPVAARH